MISLIVPGASALTVLLLTPQVQRLGLRFGFVDQPGHRKIHQQPIVRIGGLALFTGTLAAWLILSLLLPAADPTAQPDTLPGSLWGLLLGGTAFFAIGFIDDALNLSPFLRLGLQALVTVGVWSLGIRLETLPLPGLTTAMPGWLSLPVTFFWLAGMANAINWLDGMDGLAAGTTSVAAGILALLGWQMHDPVTALTALGLWGSTLSFLRFNAAPAKIFMGDGGAYFLGYGLAAIATSLSHPQTFSGLPSAITALLPFLVLAVPILDMTLVILTRLAHGKSPFFPDQRHLHHRLLQAGLPKASVVWIVYGLTLSTGLGAALLPWHPLGWASLATGLGLFGLTLRLGVPASEASLAEPLTLTVALPAEAGR